MARVRILDKGAYWRKYLAFFLESRTTGAVVYLETKEWKKEEMPTSNRASVP